MRSGEKGWLHLFPTANRPQEPAVQQTGSLSGPISGQGLEYRVNLREEKRHSLHGQIVFGVHETK